MKNNQKQSPQERALLLLIDALDEGSKKKHAQTISWLNRQQKNRTLKVASSSSNQPQFTVQENGRKGKVYIARISIKQCHCHKYGNALMEQVSELLPSHQWNANKTDSYNTKHSIHAEMVREVGQMVYSNKNNHKTSGVRYGIREEKSTPSNVRSIYFDL